MRIESPHEDGLSFGLSWDPLINLVVYLTPLVKENRLDLIYNIM